MVVNLFSFSFEENIFFVLFTAREPRFTRKIHFAIFFFFFFYFLKEEEYKREAKEKCCYFSFGRLPNRNVASTKLAISNENATHSERDPHHKIK
jgi:hypothetical protein